jgi:hypothetical protein
MPRITSHAKALLRRFFTQASAISSEWQLGQSVPPYRNKYPAKSHHGRGGRGSVSRSVEWPVQPQASHLAWSEGEYMSRSLQRTRGALQAAVVITAALFSQQAFAALTVTHLTTACSSSGNPTSTAAINPTAGSLTLLYGGVSVTGDLVNDTQTMTPSGARGTWSSQLEMVNDNENGTGRRGLYLFAGTGSVANEAVSITSGNMAGAWEGHCWSAIEIAGFDTGTPYDAAVKAGGSGTVATCPDVGTADAGDAVIFGVFTENGASVTATGFTGLGAVTNGAGLRDLHTFYDDSSPDETPQTDAFSSAVWGIICVNVNVGAGSAPTLSSPTPSGTLGTATTATIGATTDDSTGDDFYAVVDSAANLDAVTEAQIKAGQNETGSAAVASCMAAVSTSTPSCGVTGLTASTGYSYSAVQDNATGDSNIVTGTFTTGAAASALLLRRRRD